MGIMELMRKKKREQKDEFIGNDIIKAKEKKGVFSRLKDITNKKITEIVSERQKERKIYKEAYKSARKSAIKEKARIKANKIVLNAQKDAKAGGKLKRALKDTLKSIKDNRDERERRGGNNIPPMFRLK